MRERKKRGGVDYRWVAAPNTTLTALLRPQVSSPSEPHTHTLTNSSPTLHSRLRSLFSLSPHLGHYFPLNSIHSPMAPSSRTDERSRPSCLPVTPFAPPPRQLSHPNTASSRCKAHRCAPPGTFPARASRRLLAASTPTRMALASFTTAVDGFDTFLLKDAVARAPLIGGLGLLPDA